MYCVLSQNPIKDFFQATSKTEYAYNSNYFSVKPYIKKKDIYDSLFGWVNWYPLFERKPLFLAVMTDNYWFRNINDSEDGTLVKEYKVLGVTLSNTKIKREKK